jgi:hypothetical protein
MNRGWRVGFVLAGALTIASGPLHPGGSMAEMLAHPDWVLAHVLFLAAFVVLLGAFLILRRAVPLGPSAARWTRWAIAGTALQTVELIFHTLAYVDVDHLLAGHATPILTTHLWLAVVAYPIFAITIIGWILATARERSVGSPWISWFGILGAAAHGAAAPLVVTFGLERARILFPMVLLFAVWCVLAAFWPSRAKRSPTGP